MTFLNGILLLGFAAVGIPVLIHLLHRGRPRVIRWGAMHLLEASVQKISRRMRLDQLLLVLIRCSLVGGLAFLMARPVLTNVPGLPGISGGARAAAVVLDASYSMGAEQRFDAAREAAGAIIRSLAPGDSLALALAGQSPILLFAGANADPEKLMRQLEQAQPVQGRAAIAPAAQAAAAALEAQQAARRDIFIISDFQKICWDAETWAALRASRQGQLDRKLPADLVLSGPAGAAAPSDNVSVEQVEWRETFTGPGQEVSIKARVVQRGSAPASRRTARLFIDGTEESAAEIALSGGASRDLLFQHSFSRDGCHRIEVRLEADALPGDDSFFRAALLREKLPVLLVDGDPHPQPLRGETDYFRLALAPYPEAPGDAPAARNPIRARVARPEELGGLAFQDFAAVVLANVQELPAPAAAALAAFVQQGGGLLIFAGDRSDPVAYQRLFGGEGRGLLPCRLIGVSEEVQPSQEGQGIRLADDRHAALSMVFSSAKDLEQASVRRWMRMAEPEPVPADGAGGGGAARILLRLENGEPLLAEKTAGRGKVMFCATSCDDSWSNLPLRPFYVPLAQQLVAYLAAGSEARLNVAAGEPIILPGIPAGREVSIRLPDGREERTLAVNRQGKALAEFRNTVLPGFYAVQVENQPPVYFAANADRGESDLASLSAAEIQAGAAGCGAVLVQDAASLLARLREQRHGVEMWKPAAALVLLLAFLELLVEQRIEKKS